MGLLFFFFIKMALLQKQYRVRQNLGVKSIFIVIIITINHSSGKPA